MNSEHSAHPPASTIPAAYSDYLGPAVPDEWRVRLDKALAPGEKLLASLVLDLDTQLQFRSGFVALTDSRLMSWNADADEWQSWAFQPGMQLRHRDRPASPASTS